MNSSWSGWPGRLLPAVGALMGAALVGLLVIPLFALLVSVTPEQVASGLNHPLFGSALGLSLRTTALSLGLTVMLGTPLAWWLAVSSSRWAQVMSVLVQAPIVIPPAVVGVALLQTFGAQGVFGPVLLGLGIRIPFSQTAVVLAQLVVSAPFFVQAATSAFRELDPETIAVARTLGATPTNAFVRVALDEPVTHNSFLTLQYGRKAWVIGRFLTPKRRKALAKDLRAAIHAARGHNYTL